jgi:hypothetical protein
MRQVLLSLVLAVAAFGQTTLLGPVTVLGPVTARKAIISPQIVQAVACHAATAACATSSVTTTTGNWLLACEVNNNNTGTISAVTQTGATFGTQNAGFALQTNGAAAAGCVYMTITAGATNPLNCTMSAGTTINCIFTELSNVTGIDVAGVGQSNASSTTWACPTSVTTVHNNTEAFCFAGASTGLTTITAVGPFAFFNASSSNIVTPAFGLESEAVASAGTNLTPTITVSPARVSLAGVVVFF